MASANDSATGEAIRAATIGYVIMWAVLLGVIAWAGWQASHDVQQPQNAQPCVETRP